MILYVFNQQLDRIGIIEKIESLSWFINYNECGNFSLQVPLTDKNVKLLEKDNIIYKKDTDVSVDDGAEAGIIETIEKKADSNGKEVIVAKGNFITSYLGYRIVWNTINFNGKLEEFMRKVVDISCINPTNSIRKIPLLELGTLKEYEEIIKKQVSYKNLLDLLSDVAKTYEVGFRVLLYPKDKRIAFDVYKGCDKTYLNTEGNNYIVFERRRKNISEQEYTYSESNYKNCALIGGAGEGSERKFTTINNELQGLNRKELFVDAKDISDKKSVETGETDEQGNKITEEVEMTWSEYEPLLLQKGNEDLKECVEIETFEGKITSSGANKYKKDFNVGDIVTIQDKKWNLRVNTRITAIEEVYENNIVEIRPTFGNNIPTLMDKINRLERSR